MGLATAWLDFIIIKGDEYRRGQEQSETKNRGGHLPACLGWGVMMD